MRKYLLATTALVGACAVASHASADVSVSAFSQFYVNYADDDGGVQDWDFATNTEVHVKGSNTADNGFTYGLYIEIEADEGDTSNIDENNLFFEKKGFGRVELGNQDGAADKFGVHGSSVGTTTGMVGSPTFAGWNGLENGGAASTSDLNDSSDDTKITYYSPNLSGFAFGISYVATDTTGKSTNSAGIGGYENMIELGASYTAKFDGGSFKLSGAYVNADATTGSDIDSYGLGAVVGFGGIKAAIGYAQVEGGTTDRETIDFGVSYSADMFLVSFNAVASEDDGSGDEFTGYSVGARYTIAPGWSASVGVMIGDNELAAGADNDFTAVTVGTQMSF